MLNLSLIEYVTNGGGNLIMNFMTMEYFGLAGIPTYGMWISYLSCRKLFTVLLNLMLSSLIFFVSIAYAMHTPVERRSLWKDLTNLYNSMRAPWAIIGDFNETICMD